MKTDIRKQDIDVAWQNLNPGTVVTGGATAPEFNTGEWRVNVRFLLRLPDCSVLRSFPIR